VVERVPVRDPRTLAANTRFVWCGTKNGEILRISPRGKRSGVKKFARVQTDIVAMRVRGNALWAAVDGPSFEIWQYDATTGRLASTIVAGEIVLDLAVGPNAVWVPLYREGEVIRLDATRNEIVRRIVVRPRLRAVAIGDRAVWALAS
jgi:hypothetical protein